MQHVLSFVFYTDPKCVRPTNGTISKWQNGNVKVPGEPMQPCCLQQTSSEMILKEMEKWKTLRFLCFSLFLFVFLCLHVKVQRNMRYPICVKFVHWSFITWRKSEDLRNEVVFILIEQEWRNGIICVKIWSCFANSDDKLVYIVYNIQQKFKTDLENDLVLSSERLNKRPRRLEWRGLRGNWVIIHLFHMKEMCLPSADLSI